MTATEFRSLVALLEDLDLEPFPYKIRDDLRRCLGIHVDSLGNLWACGIRFAQGAPGYEGPDEETVLDVPPEILEAPAWDVRTKRVVVYWPKIPWQDYHDPIVALAGDT